MSSREGVPFTYAEIRPYAVAESLDELCGPARGALELPHELAWGGRRSFDLDDDYDRAAAYKIILEEGREEHFRRFQPRSSRSPMPSGWPPATPKPSWPVAWTATTPAAATKPTR
jgi:alkanesulfonate monooxygenase SsuD/methylene tetrahydromethanopterin reductase-like flavin-dependent oxidoreductase (luciferase family)